MAAKSAAKPKLGYRTTATEALQGADLTGKLAVVTGGNSGLGVEIVRALASAGADVVVACRNVESGRRLAAELQPASKGRLSVQQLDLASLASVEECGKALRALPRIDVLVLCAGVMAVRPRQTTADGFEMQMGVNHLGHMHLTQLLLTKLKAQGRPARIVVLSSSAHGYVRIRLDDLQSEKRWYGSGWRSYGESKLAGALFALELGRRLQGSQVEAFAVHPGIAKTSIGEHLSGCRTSVFYACFGPFLKTPSQGAATAVWAAVAPELKGQSGAYLEDCKVSKPWKQARDADMAFRLWEASEAAIAGALQRARKQGAA